MRCCEEVIVTVRLHPDKRELDMELPAFLPIEQLEQRLLEVLQEMDPLHYSGLSAVTLRSKDQTMDGEDTLAKVGIWDGSFLDVYLSKEV